MAGYAFQLCRSPEGPRDIPLAMSVFKSEARLVDASGSTIGQGMVYIHLPLGEAQTQGVQGTMSLRQWVPDAASPVALVLADGRRLPIVVDSDTLSGCLAGGRILRYRAQWPPAADDGADD